MMTERIHPAFSSEAAYKVAVRMFNKHGWDARWIARKRLNSTMYVGHTAQNWKRQVLWGNVHTEIQRMEWGIAPAYLERQ
jgi:hypothetical protein